ncbi:MAG: phasin family protein [Gammaproteobacteria bacterium]
MVETSEISQSGDTKPTMPFGELAKTMAELYPTQLMEQLTKTFSQYQLPGSQALLESTRASVDALAAANKRVLENAQMIMTRQGEILQQTMEEASGTLKGLSSESDPTEVAAKQGEILRQVLERMLDNMREVAEMTVKSNTEALTTINQRVLASLEETRGMMEKLKK